MRLTVVLSRSQMTAMRRSSMPWAMNSRSRRSVGVLQNHAPMGAAVGLGELSYKDASGGEDHLFVSGGFAEVRDNVVRVVTDVSEPISEIDVERATRASERARKRLDEFQSNDGENVDLLRARAALHRSLMRQKLAAKRR